MIPRNQFIDKHAEALRKKYQNEFDHTIEKSGLDAFRDWGGLHDECHILVCDAFGIGHDDCWDELGIFDLASDYWGELIGEVEGRLVANAFPMAFRQPAASRRAEEVLYECADIMARKGNAYNRLPQADYYAPLEALYGEHDSGESAIFTMMWQKVIRIRSLLADREGKNEFEGIDDSARDLINYTSFLIEFMEGKMDGQGQQEEELTKSD